jgi:fumigallin biosynthesis monooxygenase-like protein
MAEVKEGRWTAQIDGDFVVFLIGARLELRHPVRSFNDLGGMKGMQHMLKFLTQHPERGLLGFHAHGLTIVQYWRSFEDLERFAKNPDDPHLAPWRKYWQRVGKTGRTGIWHETFLVRAGEYESIYGNMPSFGLGRATTLVPLSKDATARGRLKRLTG